MRWALLLLCVWPCVLLAQDKSEPVCGNGVIDDREQCDDGNNKNEDGCSYDCRFEPGFVCQGEPSLCIANCGNGLLDSGEECDDGNTQNFDGCFECKAVAGAEVADFPEPGEGGKKDPQRAFQLAVAVTLFGPPGLGVIYGPAAGHFYAGETSRAIGTTFARAGLVAAQLLIPLAVANDQIEPEVGIGLQVAAGLALSTLVLVDILDASDSVRRMQKKPKP